MIEQFITGLGVITAVVGALAGIISLAALVITPVILAEEYRCWWWYSAYVPIVAIAAYLIGGIH